MLLLIISFCISLHSEDITKNISSLSNYSYGGEIVNENVSYDSEKLIDMKEFKISNVSMQLNYSTITNSSQNFYSGTISSGSVVVVSTIGLNGEYVTIKDRKFVFIVNVPTGTQNSTFHAVPIDTTSAEGTASNLMYEINLDNTLSSLIIASSDTNTVLLEKKTADGLAYSIVVSSPPLLEKENIPSGIKTNVDLENNIISINNHGFYNAQDLLYSGSDIEGLTDQTTYYAIVVDDNKIKLASSKINAINGTAIDITDYPKSYDNVTYTLTPLDFNGNGVIEFYYSNNGSDYFLYGSSITITSTTPSTSSIVDFGDFKYRYLKIKLTSPTSGLFNFIDYLYIKE